MVSSISSGWSMNSETPLPLCHGYTNRIFLTNGKHPKAHFSNQAFWWFSHENKGEDRPMRARHSILWSGCIISWIQIIILLLQACLLGIFPLSFQFLPWKRYVFVMGYVTLSLGCCMVCRHNCFINGRLYIWAVVIYIHKLNTQWLGIVAYS